MEFILTEKNARFSQREKQKKKKEFIAGLLNINRKH